MGSTARKLIGVVITTLLLSSVARADITSNLIGYWKMDESDGSTTVADSSGNSLTGTLMEFASPTTEFTAAGKVDGALHFDGSTDWVKVPDTGDKFDTITTSLTLAAWVYRSGASSGTWQGVITRQGGTSYSDHFLLAFESNQAVLTVGGNQAGTYSCKDPTTTSTGSWVHFAGTWDGTTAKLYRDGAVVCSWTRSITLAAETTPVVLGANSNNTSDDAQDVLAGYIDEARIYNRGLTASDVAELIAYTSNPNRYWIGTSSNSFSDNTKWSTTAGGANNTTAPGSGQIAHFTTGTGAAINSTVSVDGIQFASGFTGTVTASGALTVGSSGFTIAGGTFTASSASFTTPSVTMTGGTFNVSSQTSLSLSGNFTQSAGTFTPPSTSMTVTGNLSVSAGTFTAPPTLEVTGAFSHTGGTYTHGSGTVRLKSNVAQNLAATGPLYNMELGSVLTPGTNTGLILHYKLDETTGTSVTDASGSGHTGTRIGTSGVPSYSTDLPPQIDFTNTRSGGFTMASEHAIEIATTPATLKPTVYTMAAWYKATAVDSSGSSTFISIGDNHVLNLQSGTAGICKRVSGSHVCLYGTTPGNLDGNWHHLAATVSSTGMKIYYDGVEKNTNSDSQTAQYNLGPGFYVGRHGWGATNIDFGGNLDDVRIYNAALDATQIKNLYLGSAYSDHGNGSDSGLVAYWKLDETTATAGSSQARDATGNGYHATYVASSGSPTPSTDVAAGFDFTNGRSMDFDKTNRRGVQLTSLPTGLKPATVSVSAWVKGADADLDTGGSAIVDVGTGYDLGLLSTGIPRIKKYTGAGTSVDCSGTSDVVDGAWHHVVGILESTGARIYVDGVLQSSSCTNTSSIYYSTTTLEIARQPGADTEDWGGIVDDVRIYDRALTVTEVANLYAGSEFSDGTNSTEGGVSPTGAVHTLVGNLTVGNNLTINSLATLNGGASAYTIALTGAWSKLGTFTAGNSIFELKNTTGGTLPTETWHSLKINGSGATWTLPAALTVPGDLTITAGTLDVTASNYGVNVAGSFVNTGTFTPRSGTVTLNGTATGKTLSIPSSLYNLTVNGSGGGWTLGSNTTVSNALTLTAGTLNGGSATLTIPNTWTRTSGTFTAGTGTVALTGSGARTVPNETFNNLTINNASGTFTTAAALNVAGDLTITAGSLGTTAGNHALNLGGSLTNSGTFSPGSSVITLNGTASGKTFTPGVTIATLTLNGVGGAWTLGGDTTVSGNLTLTNGTLNGSTRTLTVGGTWGRTSGTFTAGTGTVALTGSGARTVPAETWNNLTLSTGTWSAGATMNVAGNLTLSSGSLAPGANTVNLGGSLSGAGTFTPGTSTIVLNGTATGKSFSVPTVHHLTVNGTGGGWTLGQALTVNGDFTLTTGTLDLGGYAMNVKGSLLRNGGTFTTGSSVITLNGTATGKSLSLGGASVGTLTINGSGGAWTLTGATSVGTLNLAAGTLLGGSNTITVSGSWANTGGTFTPGTSTVVFTGAGANNIPGQTFYSLQFNNASGTYNLQNSLALDGDLTVTAGTFNTNSNTMSVKGSFVNAGTLNAGTTVLTLNGTATGKTLTTGGATLAGLTVNGTGGGWTLGGALTLSGDLALSAGTLAQSTHNITVAGNWNKTGGTFTKGTGTATVTLNATTTGKTIASNASAFNHLTLNGVGGGWTMQDALDVDGDLTLTNGTLATGNFAVNVGGSLTRSSGTFTPGTSHITLDGTATGKALNVGAAALDRLTVSGSGGEWTMGAATTVTNALNVGPGTLKTAAFLLTNSTTATAANVLSGGTLSVGGNGSATMNAGAVVAGGGTLVLTGTTGQTATVNVGSAKPLTVNGTLTANTSGVTSTIQSVSGYYPFTVNGSGSAAVLNVDGLAIKNTDANGLTINSASAATFTSFKNVAFTNGNATASRYLSVDANALNAFFEGLTFDATTTNNVRLVGHGTGNGTVRLTLRGNSSGAGAGESRDIDDDAGGDDIPDNPATNGAVVQWVDYYTDMAGSAAGFAVPAFDWNTFTYYATYVAMRDYDGSSDYVYVRNIDGTAKGYGASIPTGSGDIMGAPRPVQTGANRYLVVLTTKGYVYKYQDTGAALTLLANWPYTGGGNCNANAQSPLIATSQYAYWTCNAATATNKIINKLDHTTANPNSASLTQTQYSTSANTATAAPVLGTVSATEYVYYVAQGSAFGMPTATMSAPLSDTTNQPSTAVSGRLAFNDSRLYFGDDNGKLWVKSAGTLAQNHWTCQDLTTHGGSCDSSTCKITNFTVGFKLTNTTTYPRVYWGDADGHVYVAYDDLGGGCAFLSGFPFQPSGTTAITAAPIFNLGNIIVGNTAGELFIINQRNGSGVPEVLKTYAFGSAISSISLDRANAKYIVLAGTKAFYLPMYLGTDTGDPAAPVAPGYFVMTDLTYNGARTSLATADTLCYNRMVDTEWLNKPATIDSAKVKAFLCDGSTCNNLAASTTYRFALMGSPAVGGAAFTTDGSGAGPNDSGSWDASDRFGSSLQFWANRAAGTATAWATTRAPLNCNNLASSATNVEGQRGLTASTTSTRWNSTATNDKCSQSHRLICFLNP